MCGRACMRARECVRMLLTCNELTSVLNQEGGGGFPNVPADGHLIFIAFYGWRGKKNIRY